MSQYADKDGRCDATTKLNQLKIPLEAEIIDTLRAAQLMGTHPKIDKAKIGFIGWSRGGNVALECSMQQNIDIFLSDFQPAFCVNYYTMPLVQRKDMPISPLLFLHGLNDDYTPISCLINYINFLLDQSYVVPKDSDQKIVFESEPIKVVIYPKSGHAFDGKQISFFELFNSIFTPKVFIENAFSFFHFLREESSQATCPDIMNLSDCCVRFLSNKGFSGADGQEHPWNEFPDYIQSKIKYGVTLEFNPTAGTDAWQETLAFIKKCTAATRI
jgi:dienelactone hydrolase